MPSNMQFQIHLGDLYREYFLLYYWQITIHSNIYWGDTNDRQQAITPTNVDKGLGRRYQSITK